MLDQPKIAVSVQSKYLAEESDDSSQQHVFAYTINIANEGEFPARILGRHWVVMDSDGNTQEIRGEGVVGEQPYLRPGENFEYTSYAVIPTPIGSMFGSYEMVSKNGPFYVEVEAFGLLDPKLIN